MSGAEIAQLLVRIGADTSKLDKALSDAEKQMLKWSRNVGRVGAEMTKYITVPAVAAGTAVLALAAKTGQYAEEIQNLSQSTGLSTKALQELKFVADEAGLSFENITRASGMVQQKLMGVEQDSGAAADALKMLGVNVHTSDGQLRSMNDLFPELISRLQNVENVTQRNMIAAQIFGRGWRELAPILGMTSTQMDEMRRKANEFGVVMGEDALRAAAEFDDALDDLKQQVIGLGRGLASEAIPILKNDLLPAIRQIIPAIGEWIKRMGALFKWFADLSPAAQKTALAIAALAVGFGPLLSIIGKVGAGIATLGKGGALGRLIPALAAVGPEILAVAAAVGALYVAIRYLTRDTAAEARAAADSARQKYEHAKQTEALVKQYQELAAKTRLSNTETTAMNDLARQIVERNPNLLAAYDAETGRIKLKAGALGIANKAAERALGLTIAQEKLALTAEMRKGKDAEARLRRFELEANTGRSHQVIGPKGGPLDFTGAPLSPENRRKAVSLAVKAKRDLDAARAAGDRLREMERTGALPAMPGLGAPGTGGDKDSRTAPAAAGAAPAVKQTIDDRARAEMSRRESLIKLGKETNERYIREILTPISQAEGKWARVSVETQAAALEKKEQLLAEANQTAEAIAARIATMQFNLAETRKAFGTALEAKNFERARELLSQIGAWTDAIKNKTEQLSSVEQREAKTAAERDLISVRAKEARADVLEAYRSNIGQLGQAMKTDQENQKKAAADASKWLLAFYDQFLDDQIKKGEERKRHEMDVLDFQREHNLISVQDYIAALKVRLSAEKEYSDNWFGIHEKIESANAEMAAEIISQAEGMAQKSAWLAADYLTSWLTAFQALGTAGTQAAEKIGQALQNIELPEQEILDWGKAFMGVVSNIADTFADTISGMLLGTTNLRDGLRQIGAQLVKFAVNGLLFGVGGGGGLFGGLFKGIGKIFGMAEGGLVRAPGLALVGERGPELVTLPRGAAVSPLDRAGAGTVINITTKVDKVVGIEDIERLSATQAMIIQRRLGLT